ncbi:MAG: calcineurin-like phosphoesterase family protein, partial [Hyphomicrobiales bacterium]|nr:calcineurin-like phosphoesterase family protein [Hyphomicrobiales bacterium]
MALLNLDFRNTYKPARFAPYIFRLIHFHANICVYRGHQHRVSVLCRASHSPCSSRLAGKVQSPVPPTPVVQLPMKRLIEPRNGDAEDDASSTKKRSLIAIAGSLIGEINLMKLVVAWVILMLLPGVLLGLAPLVVTAWLSKVSGRFS